MCLTFWLASALRATTACNFSFLIWPHGSGPAALASLLFRPSRPTNHWKNIVFRDFPNISRTCVFFLLTLSLSIFCSSLFYSSLPSDPSDLCFSSLHIVGSLTSKLPLIIPIDSMSQFAGFCMFVFWLSFVLAAKFLHGASAWVASLQRNLVLDSDVEFWICRA